MVSLTLSIENQVARVTLARSEVRNAFNEEMIAEVKTTFEQLGARDDVRAIVLGAQGPAFCAGADLNWMRRMADYTREQNIADASELAAMLQTIYLCPKPTIARVQGDAFAGGLGLVAACDIAVAADHARFCLSEVKLGLIPATISPYVVRAIGARAAHRYFLSAEVFSASTAHQIGLLHEVVSQDALDDTVEQLLQALCNAAPDAVRACKALVQHVAGRDIDEALMAYTTQGIADARASQQGREGVQSFLQKRKPNWLG
jgi:methylglutaconyl-CoA hydratase